MRVSATMFAALTRDQAAAKLRAANTAYGFVNDLAALGRHPALRRTPVALPGGGMAEIVAPAVIRTGEVPALGPVPAVGAAQRGDQGGVRGVMPRTPPNPPACPSAPGSAAPHHHEPRSAQMPHQPYRR